MKLASLSIKISATLFLLGLMIAVPLGILNSCQIIPLKLVGIIEGIFMIPSSIIAIIAAGCVLIKTAWEFDA